MTRAAFLLSLGSYAGAAQILMTGEAGDGYKSLFNGRDLGLWIGDQQRWKVERGVLTGTSGGKSASALVLGGREFGDFELRFDLRVMHGAGGVQMRGPGVGPLGRGGYSKSFCLEGRVGGRGLDKVAGEPSVVAPMNDEWVSFFFLFSPDSRDGYRFIFFFKKNPFHFLINLKAKKNTEKHLGEAISHGVVVVPPAISEHPAEGIAGCGMSTRERGMLATLRDSLR